MRWPWKRFEGIYAALVRREAARSIEAQKHQMVAALYANSAYSENAEKGTEARTEMLKAFEEHFNKAIELVYGTDKEEEAVIDWNNPFWAAAKRAQQRREELFNRVGITHDTDTVQEVVQAGPTGIDQLP